MTLRAQCRSAALAVGLTFALTLALTPGLQAQTDAAPLDGLLDGLVPGTSPAPAGEGEGTTGAADGDASQDPAEAASEAAPDPAADLPVLVPTPVPAAVTGSGGRTGTAAPRDPVSLAQGGPDYAAWRRTAERTEAIVQTGKGSDFAIERLRADLVDWRDRFLAAQSQNAARIATVRAQIDALGPMPEGDMPEDPSVTARRAVLQGQLAALRAPAILATEAHTHADGLIREIDARIRDRQAAQLRMRGTSPLWPGVWADAAMTLNDRVTGVANEIVASFSLQSRRDRLWSNLPRVIVLLAVAGFLLTRGRAWMRRLQDRVVTSTQRGRGVWRFLLSLGQIALPLLGVFALRDGVLATGMLGGRGVQLVNALPLAGSYIIFARWIAGHYFPLVPGASLPLGIAADRLGSARRWVVGLGWMLAILVMLRTALESGEVSEAVQAAVTLPVTLTVAVLLFRLGKVLAAGPPAPEAGAPQAEAAVEARDYRGQATALVGKLVMLVAVIVPLLSILGYTEAAQALIYPGVMTLALIGVVLLLQGLVFDIYTLVMRVEDGNREGLTPVLISFGLVLLALPVLSLIWGARIQDLVEIWTRFRDGYAIGETRIAPIDILTVLVVFGIGVMLTRLIQGTLRTTVLPKTRLDIGGRNAVVSGLGYVGIFLAAILAITSAGIDLSNIAIVAGALSVGIGFGLQNIVSNFVSGIILLIERPISEGDWIEVNGQMGYVRDISVRSTRIETFDRTDVIVPNADLVSGQVTNWTRGNSVGRVIVPVGVAYGTDTGRVTAILREVAEAQPMVVLAPPPAVLFIGFGADSLDFEIRAILRDVNFSLSVKSDINHAIARRFTEEGIEIPFAQRDIWLRNPEALREGSSSAAGTAKGAVTAPASAPVPAATAPLHPMLRDNPVPADATVDAGDAGAGDGAPAYSGPDEGDSR